MRKNCRSLGQVTDMIIKNMQIGFSQIEQTPFIEEIFQHEIHYTTLEQCFEELSEGIINPLKVFVSYE